MIPSRLLLVSASLFLAASTAAAQSDDALSGISKDCARSSDPVACMTSFGFTCEKSRSLRTSTTAEQLGCNVDLGNGQYRFVQMINDGAGWIVDAETDYKNAYDGPPQPHEDPSEALKSFRDSRMAGYRRYSSGSGGSSTGHNSAYATGARSTDGRLAARAVCGSIELESPDAVDDSWLPEDCEERLTSLLRKLAQVDPDEPFRIPSPNDYQWQRETAIIESGHTADVMVGDYSFAEAHTPCRRKSDCCSKDGAYYLKSCRAPTEPDRQAIDQCLADTEMYPYDEFEACLRSKDVVVGCELQPDGSSICR